ncbi:hypothetical protein B0H13DRAFT_2048476 [Mycena leptocephala]|nr:hypothetical protein B0H13DRAFT_2048476 [Mycena leptocephala]
MPAPSQPPLPMPPLSWPRPFPAPSSQRPPASQSCSRPPCPYGTCSHRVSRRRQEIPRYGRAHRRVLSEMDGRRLGPPRAPRRIPEVQVPHDGNVVFPPSLKTSQSALLARPTTPLLPRSSSPRSSTSPIIERSSPPPSLSSSRESSSATQGGAGVRTNDIALSILTLSLSPGT